MKGAFGRRELRGSARRVLGRAPASWLVAAVLLAAAPSISGCGNGTEGTGASVSSGASAAAPGSAAIPEAPLVSPPRSTSGSAIAMASDGETLFVADEDHETVFVVPASLSDPAAVKIVQMPGPPAQIIATASRVWVTVRNLPDERAKDALAKIRGPLPTSDGVKVLAAVRADKYLVDDRYVAPDRAAKYLASEPIEPEPAPAASVSASASASASAPIASASAPRPAGSTSAKAPPKPPRPKAAPKLSGPTGTPSAPLDASLVRKSQGGLLIAFRTDPDKGLIETGRVALAPDAWGLGMTPDGKRAVVTNAWSAEISVIDIAAMKVIAQLPAAREPRGVAIAPDGKTAFVSHLVGADLTKIANLDGAPKIEAAKLLTAPWRNVATKPLQASLGYALTFSPDGATLFVPRHALGAEALDAWWGATTVDVMDVPSGRHVAPQKKPGIVSHGLQESVMVSPWGADVSRLPPVEERLVQPRAVVYRKKTNTLLVAGEGMNTLSELDADSPDPSLFVERSWSLAIYDLLGQDAIRGGAPRGIALADGEDAAFVFCGTTYDVVKVNLLNGYSTWMRLANDGLPADAAKGRRLYANARTPHLSGGLACSACHPEGRDDAFTWLEATRDPAAMFVGRAGQLKAGDLAAPGDNGQEREFAYYARQTPMIAGRVRAAGPYGWHAESKDLPTRIISGIGLHRAFWHGPTSRSLFEERNTALDGPFLNKVDALMDYIQSGLLPPPTRVRDLSEIEARGKAIFESAQAQCTKCHVPDTGFTDRAAYPLLPYPKSPDFDPDPNENYKTPSLTFVGRTAPYFHDGSAGTLLDLVKNNRDRMGKTSQLSAEDQAALVAYLETL